MSQAEVPRSSALLCGRCQQMTATLSGLRALVSTEGYKHLLVEEIWKSAGLGCPLCIILRSNRYSSHPKANIRFFSRCGRFSVSVEKDRIQSESKGHPFEIAKLEYLHAEAWDDNVPPERTRSMLPNIPCYFTFTSPGDPAGNFLKVRETTISVAGRQMLQELKTLLADCCDSHSNCPKPRDTNLPSRVIDVGQGGYNELVRLHVPQPQEKAQYLALSYRWGGPQEITTTIATLQHRNLGILITTLPRTLQDAVKLTRDPGFRYFWVDALCIIQDDIGDKTAEINRMGMIYKNATLTIAAASTTSAHDSFLAARPLPRATATVPYLLPNGTFGNLWIMDDSVDVLTSPLDSRAWALQESMLSPRILWYGPADLIWKCQTTHFKEVYKTHLFHFQYPKIQHIRLPSSVFGLSQPLDAHPRAQQHVVWNYIVMDYSRRDITFPKDRLPALAGIASELQKIWPDDYLAGMWRSCLIRHLGWRRTAEEVSLSTEDDLSKLHLPPAYQSPGWSWTSYKGEVWISEVLDEHAELVECSVTLVDSTAPLSRVRDGRLVLNAASIGEEQRLKTNDKDCWFKWDYGHSFEQENINKAFRYALLGYEEKQPSGSDDSGSNGVALILTPVGDGTFMRIGTVFGFSTKDWPVEAFERQIITII